MVYFSDFSSGFLRSGSNSVRREEDYLGAHEMFESVRSEVQDMSRKRVAGLLYRRPLLSPELHETISGCS